MATPSRRDFLRAAGIVATAPLTMRKQPSAAQDLLRVRTITAGTTLHSLTDLRPVESALKVLADARRRFVDAGYQVQTVRVATSPVLARASARDRVAALDALRQLDAAAAAAGALVSIGPVLTEDRADPDLAAWGVELTRATRVLHFSVAIGHAGTRDGAPASVHRQAAQTAADLIRALSTAAPGGLANFRFAAAAGVPAGTPFFPVAYHEGIDAMAIGVESPRVVREACAAAQGATSRAEELIREGLGRHLAPVADLGASFAREHGRAWLGIDPSPAPGLDSSIGEAIETLTGVPFGAPGTVDACAAITGALKALEIPTCGYAGLMLPVLEDPVLARRATEGRYGVRDLLLFSSVCGTGLDVVPLPGVVARDVLARLLVDVAAMAARLRKPLSARLFPMPDKAAGDKVTFDDPLLVDSVAFALES